jgi:hypothetical protein
LKTSIIFTFTIVVGMLSACRESSLHQTKVGPKPVDKTFVNSNEDESSQRDREAWIDRIHGGSVNDWKAIEAENRWNDYMSYPSEIKLRNDDEWVAGNNIFGKWIERGSTNNAGSVRAIDFDKTEDIFYAVGDGGCLFKGDFSGVDWHVVNDKLRFSTNFIKRFTLPDGSKRILSALEGVPHFSDDDGITWEKSTGVASTSGGADLYDLHVTNSGIVVALYSRNSEQIKVVASFDQGKTFKVIKSFGGNQSRFYRSAHDEVKDKIYFLERNSGSLVSTYVFDVAGQNLQVLADKKEFETENVNFRNNIAAVTYRDTTFFYSYHENNNLYRSKDLGVSWQKISTLPTSPWNVGIYISPSDPRKMYYGEVNSYRSVNGGKNWAIMTDWVQYYSDPLSFVHADIMDFTEFKTASGSSFLVCCNHGGINSSFDFGGSWQNIGAYGLNVSQYYDVRTYPSDPNYVFAGAQDQGQQRGVLTDEEAAELYQNISGDYGHIQFTGNGKSLWSVYPDGSIGFYSKPLTQRYPVAGYEIKSKNESVWIPPIIPGPNPEIDEVIAAGGSVTETAFGSFLLRLNAKGEAITATQMPFNFLSFGRGNISAMAIDPLDTMTWYVATEGGAFFNSNDAGKTFKKRTDFVSEAHYLYGSCILPSKIRKDVVYLSGNGYSKKPVYVSSDRGNTWTEMSNGLPPTTVFKVVANEDETLLFAASEAGPYVYVVAKQKWFPLQGAITPKQTYWSVEYIPAIKTARFGTYGRGIWDFRVKEINTATENPSIDQQAVILYPNPSSDRIAFKNLRPYALYNTIISDAQGRIVSRSNISGDSNIDITKLPAGQYFVSIQYNRQVINNLRFTKI